MKSIGGMTIGIICTCAASLAWARTATVEVSQDEETGAFTATFANHASETNGLWVVYGATDRGEGTAGWEHAEFLQTVYPETVSVTYSAPDGWGETVKAIRFVLSEVPYDVDYTLAYLQNNMKNRICLDDFTFKGTYRVVARFQRVSYTDGSPAVFSTRAGSDSKSPSPYVSLFTVSGSSWRFDYNATVGTGKSAPSIANATDYLVDASYAALTINGASVDSRKGTFFPSETKGHLEFFCGNYTTAMGNANHVLKLYSAQVYDALDDSGKTKDQQPLLVDLVPAVKGGVVGMWDAKRSKFYSNDTGIANSAFVEQTDTRIESANPYFASALCKVHEAGPTVFTPATPTTDDTDYANPEGGILQSGVLTLTGHNNWGGQFTVKEGILKAAFGEGLGENDNLLLNGGAYGGWNGVVTNRLGTGAGEIQVASGKYLTICSLDERGLTVNIGDADPAEPIVFDNDFRRLSLNGTGAQGLVTVLNPIALVENHTSIFRMKQNLSRFEGSLVGGTVATGATVALYGDDIGADACCTFAGTANVFKTLQVFGGRYVFGTDSSTTLGGNLYVYAGELVLSNATLQINNDASQASEIRVYKNGDTYKGGALKIIGGEMTAGGLTIGESTAENEYIGPATMTIAGKLTLDPNISSATYGSATIWGSAASGALYIEDGADVNMQNLNHYRRNVFHRGGTLRLNGMYGVYNMGREGTSRYTLSGGTLYAHNVSQSTTAATVDNPTALFVFDGGTLVNTGSDNVFFADFEPSRSLITVTAKGGAFETARNTSITNELGKGSGSWNYTAEQYLTAPAFTKGRAGTLTLTKAPAYVCATDVAAGTLKLEGEDVLLPATGVVRVTGGTLDLGGKTQTLKALCGTAGTVKNGAITVTEGVFPGGKGEVGSFAADAALAGTLFVDVAADGTADQIVTTTALDLSDLDLVLTLPATEVDAKLVIVNGPTTGAFKSVTGLPAKWRLVYHGSKVTVGPKHGLAILLR